MVNPIFEPADRRNTTGRIIPVYPLTAGISNHLMLSLTQRAVEACAGSAQETLPRRSVWSTGWPRQSSPIGTSIPRHFSGAGTGPAAADL